MKIVSMNKKGGEKWLSIWQIFTLAIIAGGIVIGVLMFYSKFIDVRPAEAEIIAEKILNCVNQQGYINPALLHQDSNGAYDFDIYKECGLNKDIFATSEKFFFKISIYENATPIISTPSKITYQGNLIVPAIIGGKASLEADCDAFAGLTEGTEKLVKCLTKIEEILQKIDNETFVRAIEVVTASNQFGRRAS